MGYDDNIFQTPSDLGPGQPVLVDPGAPESVRFVPVTTTVYVPAFAGPIVYYRPVTTTTFKKVVTPARKPKIEYIKQPEAVGSLVSRANFFFDAQAFTRRSLFTFDLDAHAAYYWNRPAPSDKEEYSGSISLSYLYRLTPRLQFSTTANIAYLTQPDIQRVNTPDRLGLGNLISAQARANLSYHWTPRLSAILSVSEDSLTYEETKSQASDSLVTTVGAEVRYLWSPRITLLGEVRHAWTTYPDASGRDSTTEYLLAGGEFTLSARLRATLRLGESVRSFEESGGSSSAPYAEASLSYQLEPTSTLSMSSRYGFEEPPNSLSEVRAWRGSLTYSKSFTQRLSANASVSILSRSTETLATGDATSERTLEGSLGMEYRLTRDLTFNGNFTHTSRTDDAPFSDYRRNVIFLGLEYIF